MEKSKLETLISLGELKRYETLEEAEFYLVKNSGGDENYYKAQRDLAKKKYKGGAKLFVYIFGDEARRKVGISNTINYCSDIEEFMKELENFNIMTDLQKVMKQKLKQSYLNC